MIVITIHLLRFLIIPQILLVFREYANDAVDERGNEDGREFADVDLDSVWQAEEVVILDFLILLIRIKNNLRQIKVNVKSK